MYKGPFVPLNNNMPLVTKEKEGDQTVHVAMRKNQKLTND